MQSERFLPNFLRAPRRTTICAGIAALAGLAATPAVAQEYYLAQVLPIGGTFCPRGTLDADGRIMGISGNDALFALLGTTYGGDGQTTFALPDMRGVETVHLGQGPGLPSYVLGQRGGSSTVTLTQNTMPPHNHGASGVLQANGAAASIAAPVGAGLAQSSQGLAIYNGETPDQALNADSIGVTLDATGSGQSFERQSPYLAIRWCVVTEGVFPSQN